MKIYERPYNIFTKGSTVIVRDDLVEIVDGRYSSDIIVELYFCKVLINPISMKVTMIGEGKQVLSVIYQARRITDMRDSDV